MLYISADDFVTVQQSIAMPHYYQGASASTSAAASATASAPASAAASSTASTSS